MPTERSKRPTIRPQPNQKVRADRFARLRQAAAANANLNRLTEAEAMALVEQVRQELYDEQNEAG